jgi:hypothetical protein
MDFFRRTRRFGRGHDGAVTVDWVVLAASVVGLGAAVMATIERGTSGLASKVSGGLDSITTD